MKDTYRLHEASRNLIEAKSVRHAEAELKVLKTIAFFNQRCVSDVSRIRFVAASIKPPCLQNRLS